MKPLLDFHQNNPCIIIQNFIPFKMKPTMKTADNNYCEKKMRKG
jgi:hypothetical protein